MRSLKAAFLLALSIAVFLPSCNSKKELKVITCEAKKIGATVQFTITADSCEQSIKPYKFDDPFFKGDKPLIRSREDCLKVIGLLESENREEQSKRALQMKLAGLQSDQQDQSKCIVTSLDSGY